MSGSIYGAGDYGDGDYGRGLFPPPPPPPPPPTGGEPSTGSPRNVDRLQLIVRRLPQAPREYSQQDQDSVRRAIEQSYILAEQVRSLHFVFSGAGELHEGILPFEAKLLGWRARLDVEGDAEFEVSLGQSETAPSAVITSPNPSLTDELGKASFDLSDWSTVDLSKGACVTVELVSLDTASRATFTIDLLPKQVLREN